LCGGAKEKIMDPRGFIVEGIGVLGSLIASAIASSNSKSADESVARIQAAGSTARLRMVLNFITAVLIIGGIGTGGFFLVNKLFFNKPNTASEAVAVAGAAPEALTETETPERETNTVLQETQPAKKGFFIRTGEFFTGIGGAIKWFFTVVWNAIKTFFIFIGTAIAGFFAFLWRLIKEFFTGEFFTGIGGAIKWFFTVVWNAIKTFFIFIGTTIAGFFAFLWRLIKEFFISIFGFFKR
jgi:hypothetical protein